MNEKIYSDDQLNKSYSSRTNGKVLQRMRIYAIMHDLSYAQVFTQAFTEFLERHDDN